jgi:hypothetical protein
MLFLIVRNMSYKFNLLHNKQLFITQLKTNNTGTRTIDEGSMDEKSRPGFHSGPQGL